MKKTKLYRLKIGTTNFRESREFVFVGDRPPFIHEVRAQIVTQVEAQEAYVANNENFAMDDDEVPLEDATAELTSLKLVLEVALLAKAVPNAPKGGPHSENIRVAGTTVGTIKVSSEEVIAITTE